MKQNLILMLCSFGLNQYHAQTFINGDFENNTLSSCDYNNSDSVFNTKIPNVFAFGKKYTGPSIGYVGEVDIQTNGCYISPQNGNWCIGLGSDTTTSADAVAMELSSNLIPGQLYQLSFYVFSNSSFGGGIVNLRIGASTTDSTFGNLLMTAVPDANNWKHIVFNFTVSQMSKFITVTNVSGINGWNQIDNFVIGKTTGVSEITAKDFNIFPNPFSFSVSIHTTRVLNDATLILYTTLGQKVKVIEHIKGQDVNLFRDHLSSGSYFAELIQDNQILLRQKLIIRD